MIDRIKETKFARFSARIYNWLQEEMAPALLRRRVIGAAVVFSLIAATYWLLIASDRYVSEAHIIVQRTDLSGGQSMDFASLLGGSTGSRADELLLRDHLLSVDMLKKLDSLLQLRAHYTDSQRDPLSRMWTWNDAIELFHQYYLTRVSIELDDYAGILIIKAQGFDPKTAHAITSTLVQEGERFMNESAHKLAQEQVQFLEKQVVVMNDRVMQTRRAVLDYQNKKGLVAPRTTAEGIVTVVAKLDAQRTELETQRSSLQAYLVPDHPNIVQLNQQIAAIEKQIAQEQARLAAPSGRTLNATIEEFQRLEMEAGFAQDVYKTALVALEKGRIEALRTIKKVTVLQAPTEPEYPLQPRRLYNTLVFIIVALLLAGVIHLLAAIVRDHKD